MKSSMPKKKVRSDKFELINQVKKVNERYNNLEAEKQNLRKGLHRDY